jgi:purine-binding chemotaxis protein CheW
MGKASWINFIRPSCGCLQRPEVFIRQRLAGVYHHLAAGQSPGSLPKFVRRRNFTMQTSGQKPGSQGKSSGGAVTADGGQYLTLRLGTEEYAIDILRVQEIRSYEEPNKMVNAPDFIKGVINLRGDFVPIVDLRIKLNIAKVEYTEFTVVIILNVRGTVIGTVVDSVSDVVTLHSSAIKPAPQFDTSIDARFITGLAKLTDRMLILINIEALLSNAELGMVEKALHA